MIINRHTEINKNIKQIKRYKKHDLKSIVQQGKGRTIEESKCVIDAKKHKRYSLISTMQHNELNKSVVINADKIILEMIIELMHIAMNIMQ